MKDKDTYLFLGFALTFLLLVLAISLLGEAIGFKYYLLFGLILGFGFSWVNRERYLPLLKYFINIVSLSVVVWIIYSILNSRFFYKEIILIFIKGILTLAVIISFNAQIPLNLTYMQALSLPLFMSHPLFIKDYEPLYFILTLGYLIGWLFILKVKFYGLFTPFKPIRLKQQHHIYLPITLFVLSLFISWIFFSHIPLGKIKKGGLLPEEEVDIVEGLEKLEKEYYDYQDRIQKEIIKLILQLGNTQDRYEMFELLNKLIQEPSGIIEVEKAQQGLISHLKTPGLGLERDESEQLIFMIKGYLDKKAVLNLKRAKENIIFALKKQHFTMKDIFSILFRLNKVHYSNSYAQVRRYKDEIKQFINKPPSDSEKAKEPREHLGQFEEWKVFEIYHKKLDSLHKKIDSLNAQLKEEFMNLPSEIDNVDGISSFKEMENKIKGLKEKIKGLLPDFPKETQEILDLKLEMLLLQESSGLKEKLKGSGLPDYKTKKLEEELDGLLESVDNEEFLKNLLKFQEKAKQEGIDMSKGLDELSQIKASVSVKEKEAIPQGVSEEESMYELKKDLEKKEAEKIAASNLKESRLISLISKIVFILVLGLIIGFAILYYLIEKEKNKLRHAFQKNPREFIIRLYENTKRILDIFKLRYQASLPPLSYAELVQRRYSIEDNLFLRFTMKFEEAKYSQHILQPDIAKGVLNEYNSFLKILFRRQRTFSLFFKYCSAFLRQIPLLISLPLPI